MGWANERKALAPVRARVCTTARVASSRRMRAIMPKGVVATPHRTLCEVLVGELVANPPSHAVPNWQAPASTEQKNGRSARSVRWRALWAEEPDLGGGGLQSQPKRKRGVLEFRLSHHCASASAPRRTKGGVNSSHAPVCSAWSHRLLAHVSLRAAVSTSTSAAARAHARTLRTHRMITQERSRRQGPHTTPSFLSLAACTRAQRTTPFSCSGFLPSSLADRFSLFLFTAHCATSGGETPNKTTWPWAMGMS